MTAGLKSKISTRKHKPAKVIVIVGPTASGKTGLSLNLARIFNGAIVSADSRQIYKGLDIGTAKPTKKDMEGIKHFMLDIRKPNEDYSAGQYKRDAITAINKILKSGKVPIIVGGTGLYVSSIVDNLSFPEIKENKKLRLSLEEEIEKEGIDSVYKKLIEIDPEAAYIVDPKNPRRIIRALEIAILSKRPFSQQRESGNPLFDFLQIGLKVNPDVLKERIKRRTQEMIKLGLVEETQKIIKKYDSSLKPLDAIGYREIIIFLKNIINLHEAEDLINKNTWHYAKRQMSWFKRDQRIKWFDTSETNFERKIFSEVKEFVG